MSTATKTPVQAAMPYAAAALDLLRPHTDRAELAGSIRRLRPTVGDIEIVAEPSSVVDGLFGEERLSLPEIRAACDKMGRVTKGGERMIQVADVFGSGITLDLFLVHPPAEWGVILAIRTGPAPFSRALVTRIKGRLWRCKDGWVRDDSGRRVPCPTEREFFAAAGLAYLAPEDRTEALT
jgi:DNA polymerase/3'-5' exonuclease PolX